MRKIPKNKQKSIVKQYHEGAHVGDLCKRYNIPKSTLYTWIYKYPPLKLRNKILAPTTEHKSIQRYTIKLENELVILRSFMKYRGATRKSLLKR